MAHQPRSVVVLVVVVLFLAIHVSSASPLSLTHYNDSMCSESFECGGVNITYPFFLSSATEAAGDYTSYSCGYTDLKVFCDGERETKTPILQLGSYKYNYTILDISYDNRTILLADTELLAGGKCPTVLRHNVTFGDEWLSYAGDSSVHSLTFFSDCDPAPPETEKYQINCKESSNPPGPAGSRGRVSFVFPSEEHVLPREYRLAERCRDIVVVPVRADTLVAGDDQDTLPREYGAMVQRGFQLVWNQSTTPQEPCYMCEQSDGRCAYSEKTEFVGCLCSGGKVGLQDCHSSGATAASASSKFFCPKSEPILLSYDSPICRPTNRTTCR